MADYVGGNINVCDGDDGDDDEDDGDGGDDDDDEDDEDDGVATALCPYPLPDCCGRIWIGNLSSRAAAAVLGLHS